MKTTVIKLNFQKLYFILVLILCSISLVAQSSFFGGVNCGIYSTTLINTEDKNAPNGMLDKKNGVQMGYGVHAGYSYKNKIKVSTELNYLQYKVMYNGANDTTSVRSFNATAQFKYYQIPLILSYNYALDDRISLFAGFGISYNHMTYYKEEVKGNAVVINSPTEKYSYTYITTGTKGYFETPDDNDGKIDIVLTNPMYLSKSFSLICNIGSEYALTNKLGISLKMNYQRGISNIENKGIGKETVTHQKSGTTYTNTIDYWNETNYLRYYYRHSDKYDQRKQTYTQAMGLSIGLNYYFNGGHIRQNLK